MRIKARMDEIKADPRYGFMFSGMMAGDTMADVIAKLLRLPGDGKPLAIVDLSGVPSEVTAVVVALLARMVFDHAIWARGDEQHPILLICEEAHRYIPADEKVPARAVLERIAKEGRKYGVSLGLVTQRPSDLAEGVLSQCGTIVAMRLNNERDQSFVRSAVPEAARGMIDAIPALRNREAIIVGEGVPIPIRVSFDPLDERQLPASHDPVFSEAWQRTGGERAQLERTIKRWRAQGR
jgi:DNA helicase HerA-like ATPase